jgi:mannose-6-phosphate isomerase-like protein (cupin superfamily)
LTRIDKAWGYEIVIVNEPEYCAKFLHIDAGKKSSLHYHAKKKETFFVQSGLVRLERLRKPDSEEWNIDELLKFGEQRTIHPGTPHRFSSVHGGTILEISTHHEEADVIRIEPSSALHSSSENAVSNRVG